MSSNIRIQRVCQHCRKEFMAKTTVTKFCSADCSKRSYKQRKRGGQIQYSEIQTTQIKSAPMLEIQSKDFISITEASLLLGVSRWTVSRAVANKTIPSLRLGRRIVIKRNELDKLFER